MLWRRTEIMSPAEMEGQHLIDRRSGHRLSNQLGRTADDMDQPVIARVGGKLFSFGEMLGNRRSRTAGRLSVAPLFQPVNASRKARDAVMPERGADRRHDGAGNERMAHTGPLIRINESRRAPRGLSGKRSLGQQAPWVAQGRAHCCRLKERTNMKTFF